MTDVDIMPEDDDAKPSLNDDTSREELLQRVLGQMQKAYDMAIEGGNAAAATQAAKAIADLLALKLAAPPPEPDQPKVVDQTDKAQVRHTARALLNAMDEACRETGIEAHYSEPGDSVIRIRTPADSELLKRLYPDSFRQQHEMSFAEKIAHFTGEAERKEPEQ